MVLQLMDLWFQIWMLSVLMWHSTTFCLTSTINVVQQILSVSSRSQSLWHLWSEVMCEYYVFISTLAFVLYVKSWLWFLLKGKWYLFQVVFFLVTYVVPMVGLSVTYSHLGSVLWAAQQTRSSQYHHWSLFQKESTMASLLGVND